MIIEILPNSNPKPATIGNAYKFLGPSIPEVPVAQQNDICICDFVRCKYTEVVFGHNGNESYKKDYSEFLFKRFINTDSVSIFLQKNEEDIVELNNNTYGTLFDGFPSGNDEQQLYYGFLLDWSLVLNTFGNGFYNIRAELDILGNETEYISRQFELFTYSDLAADGTVKIESFQNGNIIGNEFDFTGLNWFQSLRIPGRFGNPTPTSEVDRYQNEQREFVQIKSTRSRLWTLETKLINWEVADKLVYNKLLSNQILITDYSIKAESIWRQVNVKLEDIEKPPLFNTPNKRYNITFVDNKDIFQKRNF